MDHDTAAKPPAPPTAAPNPWVPVHLQRLAETAREAGAAHPEQLGEQLALLLDGASARTRVLNTDTFPAAAAIAAVLIDNAIPTAARGSARGNIRSAPVRVAGERQPGQAS